MLFSDLVADLASGRKFTDEGLSRERAQMTGLANTLRLLLARYLSRFKHYRRRLADLEVQCQENPDLGAKPDEACVNITSGDPSIQAVARAAFAAGLYYGQMNSTFFTHINESRNRLRSKKAGEAGGKKKKEIANKSHVMIREAYARWAAKPTNEQKKTAAFIEDYVTKKTRRNSKGPGRETIAKAVRVFHAEILAMCDSMNAGSMTAARRDKAVTAAMQGRSGVTLATVRRALK